MNEIYWVLSGVFVGYILYRLINYQKIEDDSYEGQLKKVLENKENKVKGRYDE